MQKLTPEAELAFTRGMLHLRRGEQIMPTAMSAREDKVPPGTDVLLSLVSLAAVATSRALGQTRWIEEYRQEMRQALVYFDQVAALVPDYPEVHFRRSQALRYLGENDLARDAARRATELEPNSDEYQGYLRVLDGGAAIRRPIGGGDGGSARGNQSIPEVNRGLTWDDIILPPRTKRELRQMQSMLENPAQAKSLGVDPPTGLLLYGPSGTGKTTIARILASQAKCRFFSSTPAEINSMWMGESEKAVARLFTDARAAAPSIIFLDEMDALVPTRSGGINQYSDKVVNQFLLEMDGLRSTEGVFVIGATNRPDMLDASLLRGGRLSRQIEIPLPNEEARFSILLLHTREARMDPAVDLGKMAKDTDGFSGADLKALINEAGLQALIRLTDEPESSRLLTPIDFTYALENMSPGDGG